MEERRLQLAFAISCKNNLSDLSVPGFNVTDCSSQEISTFCEHFQILKQQVCLKNYGKQNNVLYVVFYGIFDDISYFSKEVT